MKLFFMLVTVTMFATALVGCRAEAEVGDAASNVSVPR